MSKSHPKGNRIFNYYSANPGKSVPLPAGTSKPVPHVAGNDCLIIDFSNDIGGTIDIIINPPPVQPQIQLVYSKVNFNLDGSINPEVIPLNAALDGLQTGIQTTKCTNNTASVGSPIVVHFDSQINWPPRN